MGANAPTPSHVILVSSCVHSGSCNLGAFMCPHSIYSLIINIYVVCKHVYVYVCIQLLHRS